MKRKRRDRMTYREACREAIREALQRDPRTFLMGEDVGLYGGCYAVSKGLLDEFGPKRIRDTPLVRKRLRRRRHRRGDGGYAADRRNHDLQFQPARARPDSQQRRHDPRTCRAANSPCRWSSAWRPAPAANLPPSIRTVWKAGIAHIPGIKVLAPGTIEDARYMLKAALADPDPGADLRAHRALQYDGHASRRCGPGRYR